VEHMARERAAERERGARARKGAAGRRRRPHPSQRTLERWVHEGGGVYAVDGCWVEPDGVCEHGSESWLLRLGLI
jgi:hypothetical protein